MHRPAKAMLFAAGLGTRLRPLTLATPKPLIALAGKPLIAYALETLRAGGVREVMINTHWLRDLIAAAVGNGRDFGLRCVYSPEPELLGTGGGLYHARDFFNDVPAFWVLNSDTLLDVDLQAVAAAHGKSGATATVVTHTQVPPEFGGVWVDPARSRVAAFLTPPLSVNTSLHEVDYCGLSLLNSSIFSYLEQAAVHKKAPCLIRDGLEPLHRDGYPIAAYPVSGYFNDVGTLARLAAAERHLASRAGGV